MVAHAVDEETGRVERARLCPDHGRDAGLSARISALTGLALSVEIGDWSRFTGASIGAYVGLVPTEYSCVAGAGLDHQSR